MRKFIVCFLMLMGVVGATMPLSAQSRSLAVELHGQRARSWCWAASMKMVMDYQLSTDAIDQCTLAGQLQEILGVTINCAQFCQDTCDITTVPTNSCNVAIPFSGRYPTVINGVQTNVTNYEKSYMDFLFINNGFYSIEDYEKLNWDQYKNEIDQCRPVIFFYAVKAYESDTVVRFPHVVVGRGYTTITGSSAQAGDYFVVNDPWSVCYGEQYLLKKEALSGVVQVDNDTILQVNRFYAMTHHISPRVDTCNTCDLIPEKDRFTDEEQDTLLTTAQRYANAFAPLLLGSEFNKRTLNEFEGKDHFFTPLVYFSYTYFDQSANNKLSFEQALADTNLLEVTYTPSEPALNARLRCNTERDYCSVETIELMRDNPDRRVNLPGLDKLFTLSNDPDLGVDNPIPYTIVRFPPTIFEFYRFEYEGKFYYLPIDNYSKMYFYGVEYQKSNVGIPEVLLLQGLKQFVQNYDDDKLLGKDQKNKARYSEMLSTGGFLKMRKYMKLRKF